MIFRYRRSKGSVAAVLGMLVGMSLFAAAVDAQITETKLTASDAAALDFFGVAVSVSGDTAVVGAPLDDDAGKFSGSAYVFVRDGTTWGQEAKLTASDAATFDQFGGLVAVSGDTVVVAATGDDDAGSASGSAYVFVRDGTTWTEQAKLTASDAAADDRFGNSVSLSEDTVVLGARRDDDAGSNSGSAYVFVRSGTTWTEQAKLTASDGAAGDFFGRSVSFSEDTAVVGAGQDDDAGPGSGSAYVFERDGTTWTQQAKLTASDGASGDGLGNSVSISGENVVVGAAGDDDAGDRSGSAYVFTLVKKVSVDIKPGSFPNSINMKSRGTIPVAILSTSDFDATAQVDKTSLTFGKTGDEESLAKCPKSNEDVNGDGLLDVVCHFRTQETGFQAGDTQGILRGQTVDGRPIEGSDFVRILHG